MLTSSRTIHHSSLFYCHPHLLRQLGVHTTVLNLMKTYLGISSGSPEDVLLSSRRRYRQDKKSSPVEACCKFLCKFAKISQENQRALFAHIGYLIQHASKYPGMCVCVCVCVCVQSPMLDIYYIMP